VLLTRAAWPLGIERPGRADFIRPPGKLKKVRKLARADGLQERTEICESEALCVRERNADGEIETE
jgi:hypothetical protein